MAAGRPDSSLWGASVLPPSVRPPACLPGNATLLPRQRPAPLRGTRGARISAPGSQQQGRKPGLSVLGWGPESPPRTQGLTPQTLTAVSPPSDPQGWAVSPVRYPWQDGASSLKPPPPPWQGCLSPLRHLLDASGHGELTHSLADTPAPGSGQQGPLSCVLLSGTSRRAGLTSLLHEAEQVIQELLPLGVPVQFVELRRQGGDGLVGARAWVRVPRPHGTEGQPRGPGPRPPAPHSPNIS